MLAPLHDDNTRIVVSTFEQLRIHRLRNTHIPDEWMIWFDDPDITDVIDIERYDTERWQEVPDDQLEEKTREINGRRYFKRNPHQSLGYSLKNHKCIYTTTEIITKLAIEQLMKQRNEEFVVHDKMDIIMGERSLSWAPNWSVNGLMELFAWKTSIWVASIMSRVSICSRCTYLD